MGAHTKVFRWQCCRCGGQNSCDVDARCALCHEHWKDGCCNVYEVNWPQRHPKSSPDEFMLSRHAPETESVTETDDGLIQQVPDSSEAASSSVTIELFGDSQEAIPVLHHLPTIQVEQRQGNSSQGGSSQHIDPGPWYTESETEPADLSHKSVQCRFCDAIFTGMFGVGDLGRHATWNRSHPIDTSISCRNCNKRVLRADSNVKHERNIHRLEISKPDERSPVTISAAEIAESRNERSFGLWPTDIDTPRADSGRMKRVLVDVEQEEQSVGGQVKTKVEKESANVAESIKTEKEHSREPITKLSVQTTVKTLETCTEVFRAPECLIDDDCESIASSYANSVSSTTSIASSATNLSLHSKYSPTQILEATRELITLLRDDQVLALLYKHAIVDTNIGPERLKRNLRRLFKNFAELLGEEAGDPLQFQASRLVSVKAKDVAQAIMDKYVKSDSAILDTEQTTRNKLENDIDDEYEAQPLNESMFNDLIIFREFLLHSAALLELRAKIRCFVLPELESQGPHLLSVVEDSASPDKRSISSFDDMPLFRKATEVISKRVTAALVVAGYLEPPLMSNFTRLRWQCKCGDVFFGDVLEYHEGGVAKMVDRMQRSMGVRITATPYSSNTSNQKYTFRVPTWLRDTLQKVAATFGRSNNPATLILPIDNNDETVTANGNQITPHEPHKTLHLMACMQHGRYRRTLHQQRIEDIKNDRALFCVMRSQAAKYHGFVWKFLSLKCIQGLYFVKFRLRICGSAEVRNHFPCCTSSPLRLCECIPPASKVEPEPGAEYRCTPAGPLDVWPPILSQELMHMLTSPNCIHEDQTFVLEQLPKRTNGELRGSTTQPVEGWGIYYEEGWNIDLILGIVLVVFLLASLLFGILWSCLRLDIQGAFGVSSYMVTASGILIAWIANRAGKLE